MMTTAVDNAAAFGSDMTAALAQPCVGQVQLYDEGSEIKGKERKTPPPREERQLRFDIYQAKTFLTDDFKEKVNGPSDSKYIAR